MMESGKRLRALRRENNMTQAQLAEKLGVTEFTVCRYENGRIAMPIEAIKKAAAVFDACPAYFIGGVDCKVLADQDLMAVFLRAEKLDAAKRTLIKQTVKAMLDSLGAEK